MKIRVMMSMRWKLLSVLLLDLLLLSSFESAGIVKDNNDKACQPVNYWISENGQWVEKSEPRAWWYCQEPEKIKNFDEFAFKKTPYNLFKKPDPMALHQAARDLTDLVGVDELHRKSSKNLPSYGGMFINEEKGLIFVYIGDEKDKAELRQALRKYRGKVNLVFLRGKYRFNQLERWKRLIEKLDARTIRQLGITMIDVDEAHDSLTIGLEQITPDKLKLLENELEKLGIPKEAVRVEKRRISLENSIQSASISPASSTSITLMGGMPIIGTNIEGEHGIGTLGYVGYLNGDKYFVTAGHAGSWGYTGQEVYDSNWIKIGIITRNPPFKYSSGFGYYRYSDAALVKVINPNANIVPRIYPILFLEYTWIIQLSVRGHRAIR